MKKVIMIMLFTVAVALTLGKTIVVAQEPMVPKMQRHFTLNKPTDKPYYLKFLRGWADFRGLETKAGGD